MNNSNFDMNDPEKLTVAEYAKRYDMSENTVRTRINRKKLKTVKENVDGRETILILVESSMDHSLDDTEQFETVQAVVQDRPFEQSEQSHELLSFMRETLQTVQGYSSQIVELSRENERYKLLTDNSSRTLNNLEREIEQLKEQLFEKDARIKELELQNPDHELQVKVKQLEAQLVERNKTIENYNNLESKLEKVEGELAEQFRIVQVKDEDLKRLTVELETIKNKSPAWMFWAK